MAAACRPAWRTSLLTSRPCRPLTHSKAHTRNLWTSRTSHPSSRVQVYISHSHDPYLNLSAEHLLLQRSHPDSTVLLLYANDPCVVIGRNQNPWVEVSLGLLRRYRPAHDSASSPADKAETGHSSSVDSVALVRRRSGGGTVFHDHGNVNFSVICPSAVFDRDRHAEMVVRALRRLGIPTAHVNARHDIVVDDDASHSSEQHQQQTFKVSGSAYKLTRLRSLHHGTCLLSSPNLAGIGRLLRSPAEPFIKTRGVESVRSRIRNLGLAREDFVGAVTDEFARMYGAPDVQMAIGGDVSGQDFYADEIQRGYRELTSLDWIYKQTPQFTFSTHPTEEDPRSRPPFPSGVPQEFRATITARHGQIQHIDMPGVDGTSLQGQDLHQITDWRTLFQAASAFTPENTGTWFNHLFGVGEI